MYVANSPGLICDISASESSFLEAAVCAGLGDALVRNDREDDHTSRAQPRLTHAKAAFVPAVHFGRFIALPSLFRSSTVPYFCGRSVRKPPSRKNCGNKKLKTPFRTLSET